MLALYLALGPLVGAALAVRRRWFVGFTGPAARLVEILLVLGTIVVVSELLGTVGLFRLVPLTIALVAVGIGAWRLVSRTATTTATGGASGGPAAAGPGPVVGTPGHVAMVVAVGLLVGTWGTRTVDALMRGMDSIDTIWYHMPTAARFAQTGSTTGFVYVDSGGPPVFYPATTALLHGFGIVYSGTDVFSPLMNLGWVALALLAAWCIGRPFGVAPVSVIGVALVLMTPGFVATQPGGAYNDVAGVALLLSAVALMITSSPRRLAVGIAPVVLGGVAVGLAAGSKWSLLAPSAVVALGLLAASPAGARLRRAPLCVAAVAVAGAYFYLRNLVRVDNPLPYTDLSIGPLDVPVLKSDEYSSTVLSYLFDGAAWSDHLLDGLRASLGPAWPLVIALTAVGIGVAVVPRATAMMRLVGLVALGMIVGYVVTPHNLGPEGAPIYFGTNFRYVAPALAVALALLPTAGGPASRRVVWLALIGAMVAVGVTQLDATLWSSGIGEPFGTSVEGPARVAGLVLGLTVVGIGVLGLRAAPEVSNFGARTSVRAMAAVVGVFLIVAAAAIQTWYLQGRYAGHRPYAELIFPATSYAWAQNIRDARIAYVGGGFVYPFVGPDVSNHVEFLVEPSDEGEPKPIRKCEALFRRLNRGRFDYLVAAPNFLNLQEGVEVGWLRRSPASDEVVTARTGKVFAINGVLDEADCPPA